MSRPARLTLTQLFVGAAVAITVVVGVAFVVLVESSRRSVVAQSEKLRDAEAQRVAAEVRLELDVAGRALRELERTIRLGVTDPRNITALEATLFATLVNQPKLSDISFTHAGHLGFDETGAARFAPLERFQVTVLRRHPDPESEVITHTTRMTPDGFVAEVRERPPGGGLGSGTAHELPHASDPTRHATFEVVVSRELLGTEVWSDLHYSELDARLPQAERRIVLTVQKAVNDPNGKFAGVLRVGLLTYTIDELSRTMEGLLAPDATRARRVVLCDERGRLISRSSPSDRLELSGDDLRVVSRELTPEVVRALASPRLADVRVGAPQSDEFEAGGKHLVSFRALENTQGWIVGIVVPEAYYTRDLNLLRSSFLRVYGGVSLLVLFLGAMVMRQLRSGLGGIVRATARMRALDFSPSASRSGLRDIAEIGDELERAKTSMRALSKYVPMDLVRELYAANQEPVLGGELVEVSLMFTDIEGFTTLSEQLAPAELAEKLGHYLEAMTRGVRSTDGTVDKFIGDAVMAFWNAPRRVESHAASACRAVLACRRRATELFASAAWQGLSPLVTRFGVHKAKVMVGHFGSPERLSYTALGDGVNLAARLEGLCKQYGVAVLVSDAIVEDAQEELRFRLIDKVAVKGKTRAVEVYELLGERDDVPANDEVLQRYERALRLYWARDFGGALSQLADPGDDAPSRVLTDRCKEMQKNPPPEGWDGVFVAMNK